MSQSKDAEVSRDLLESSRVVIERATKKVVNWARARIVQVEEGLFTQIGVTLADPQRLIAGWLLLSGELSSVVGAIVRALGG